jgi:hypothetical protein
MDAEDLVAAWTARDHTRALLPEDHAAIDGTHAARTVVIERILSGAHADLFHGCLVLGRLLAVHGASPTLATATIDGAIEVTKAAGEWIGSARAALAEGYAAARRDAARAEAMAEWDYARCAVKIDGETTAFAAGAPEDDEEALHDWAAKVAVRAQRDKVRRAIVGGAARPRAALEDALALAGIHVVRDEPRRASLFRWFSRGTRR